MLRKFSAVIAMLALLVPLSADALGLGQLRVNSALTEPLDAEIVLLSVGQDEADSITARLASAEAFTQVGLERPFSLSALQFAVERKADGQAIVRVTTEQPIREPFLSFLVEVDWPRGRLLREYTALLDPPTTAEKATPAMKPAQTQSAQPTAPAPSAQAQPQPAITPATPAPMPGFTGDTYGPIQRGETLYQIANSIRPSSDVTVEQMMIALVNANPEAFYQSNINRMKAGYVLRVPDREEVLTLSQAQALQEVRSHNAEWNLYRQELAQATAAPQVAGRVTGGSGSTGDAEPRLKLVAPAESGENTTGGAGGGDAEERIALANETAEARRLENQELQGRINEMESKVDELERMIALKNEELAGLEARLRANGEAAEQAVGQAGDSAAAPATEQAPAPGEQVAEATPATTDGQPAAVSEGSAADAPQTAAPEQTPTPAPAPAPVQEPPKPTPVVAPPMVVDEPGIVDFLMENLTIVGGAAIALLLIILLVVKRLRGSGDDEEEGPSLVETHTYSADEFDSTEPSLMDTIVGEDLASTLPGADERGSKEKTNFLAEADVYIAYGNHGEAEQLMRRAVDQEPGRQDYRLKLLEILHASGDGESFDREAEALHAVVDSDTGPVWSKVVAMGRDLSPANPLFAEGVDESPGSSDSGLDFDFDNEPMQLGDGTDEEPPLDLDFALPEQASGKPADNSIDFHMDLGGTVPPISAEAPTPADEHNVEFDMSLLELEEADSGSNASSEEAAGQENSADIDLEAGLDFDFNLGDDDAAEPSLDMDLNIDESGSMEAEDLDLHLATVKGEAHEQEDGSFNIEWDVTGSGEFPKPDLSGVGKTGESAMDLTIDLDSDQVEELGDLSDLASVGGDDQSMVDTKLDLARAYIDMGDEEGARGILEEVLGEGSADQKQKAESLLGQLG